jgi:hypothetical protein
MRRHFGLKPIDVHVRYERSKARVVPAARNGRASVIAGRSKMRYTHRRNAAKKFPS